jgi:hypothetical protein
VLYLVVEQSENGDIVQAVFLPGCAPQRAFQGEGS